jgi:antitoxin CptB
VSELARLRWRARRGTRELDQLLGWWLDERHGLADAATRADFADLLEMPDPDLWDWLMGKQQPTEPRFAALIDEIRTHHRV